MAVVTPSSQGFAAVGRRLGDPASATVVAFCAAWCDACAEFRATLERIAQARPDTIFVWLDIEDDSEICGDIDIENFPTLAIFRGERLLHYGVSLPLQGAVSRLIDEGAARHVIEVSGPRAVSDLPHRLRATISGE
jgi:thioredoxin 1